MLRRKLNRGDIFLIIVNLIPLYGVLFKGWFAEQMFLVYCLETVIIGCFNILKMAAITLHKKKDVWEYNGGSSMVRGWFFILFFIIHYGLFVFIQTSIFIGTAGFKNATGGPLSVFSNIVSVMNYDTKEVLLFFIIMYALKMLFDFILNGQYKQTSLGSQMFQPYGRIFIQQFVVILGSLFLQFGAGKIFMIIFVCIKLYFELFLNLEKIIATAESKRQLEEKLKTQDQHHK